MLLGARYKLSFTHSLTHITFAMATVRYLTQQNHPHSHDTIATFANTAYRHTESTKWRPHETKQSHIGGILKAKKQLTFQHSHPSNWSPASIVRVFAIADRRLPILVSVWMSIPRICHWTLKIHFAFDADESVAAGRGLIVREHTSYVPCGTTTAFITISSFGSGFQSSQDTSKSSANRRQNPTNIINKSFVHDRQTQPPLPAGLDTSSCLWATVWRLCVAD